MPSPLRQAINDLVAEVLAEQQQQTQQSDPQTGTVASLNDDGTINVGLSDGTLIQNCGAAIQFTIGAQVIVITAQGVQTAVPYQ